MSEPTRSELIAGELKRVLTYGCSNHGCVLHKNKRGMGTCGPCKCLEAIYDLSLELSAELESIKNRRGISWVPHEEF